MTEEVIDVPAFMQHVRGQGFDIEDEGYVFHGVIRRFVISKGDSKNYLDIDRYTFEGLTQDDLLQHVNPFMDSVKKESSNGILG